MPEPAVGADRPDPLPDPSPDATDRLRALLREPEPWGDRLRDRVAASLPVVSMPTRSIVVVLVAIGLGTAAFLAVGSARASSIDPVQVLPRVATDDAPATAGASVATTAVAAERTTTPGSSPASIRVHAAGAVQHPGVHELGSGARVSDLIEVAGGLRPDADPDRINLAAPVADGARVYVPRLGETEAPSVVAGDGPAADGSGSPTATGSPPGDEAPARVDLNRADAAALDALPGVGPATAAAIIGHREENGPFTSVDQLQDVAGIGPAKLARLRDLVTV